MPLAGTLLASCLVLLFALVLVVAAVPFVVAAVPLLLEEDPCRHDAAKETHSQSNMRRCSGDGTNVVATLTK